MSLGIQFQVLKAGYWYRFTLAVLLTYHQKLSHSFVRNRNILHLKQYGLTKNVVFGKTIFILTPQGHVYLISVFTE